MAPQIVIPYDDKKTDANRYRYVVSVILDLTWLKYIPPLKQIESAQNAFI